MSNNALKQPKGRKPQTLRRETKPRKLRLKSVFTRVWGAFLVFCAALALLSVLPRISVLPSDPVDPNNSMSSSFLITNTGFIPLRHLTVALALGEVTSAVQTNPKDAHVYSTSQPSIKSALVYPDWIDHRLDMDESFTVSPSQVFQGTGWGEANIAFVISYHPWFLPWVRQKYVHFHTERQTNGNLTWYILPNDPQPTSN